MLFQGSNTFYNITTNILKLDLIMVFLIYGIMDKSMFQLYYKVSGKIMVLEIAGKIYGAGNGNFTMGKIRPFSFNW